MDLEEYMFMFPVFNQTLLHFVWNLTVYDVFLILMK